MKIEITDIPENRLVKHINIDITFEEGTNTEKNAKNTGNIENTENTENTKSTKTIKLVSDNISSSNIYHPIENNSIVPDISNREQKEPPEEMRDLEF